ncbi:hypothetical protein BDZ91DRAFT_630374, partial [Kalaharituber pfeilii]
SGSAHTVLRIVQVLTLVPAWAMLAAVIDHYNRNDALTPGSIHFLFVVTLLCSVWAFCILITYLRARNTALWITFFDIVAMGLLIGGVVVTADIANGDCVAVDTNVAVVEDDGPFTYRQHCSEIKAAWGLAITNIVLFFLTAILAAMIYRQNQGPVVRE